MKTRIYKIILISFASTLFIYASANSVNLIDTTTISTTEATDTISTNNHKYNTNSVEINGKVIEIANNHGDTVVIRIGDEIIRFPRNNHREKRIEKRDKRKQSFHGHYAGINFGKPLFTNTDYSMYADPNNEFMDLNSKNSIEFNINFAQKEFAFNKAKTIGLVTGLGASWGNYHFEEDITIDKLNGMIIPVDLTGYSNIKKTKLTTLYLDVPLVFEFQLRERGKKAPLYIAAGGIGGVKLGSHTKIKHKGGKDKDHGGFYISPFRYGATVRVGYENLYIYANYYANDFFESNKGPILNQYTIGIGLTDD